MNDTQGNNDGYWQASDGQWYPPEQHPFNIERAELEAAKAAKKAVKATKKEAKAGKKADKKADKKAAKAEQAEEEEVQRAYDQFIADKEAAERGRLEGLAMREDHDNGVLAAKESMTWLMGSRRDIKKIKDHLYEGEIVEGIASAALKTKTGALVLTDQRIMFVRSGRLSQDVIDIPRDRIGSVHFSGGIVLASLEFHTSNMSLKVTNMVKKDAKLVKQRIG